MTTSRDDFVLGSSRGLLAAAFAALLLLPLAAPLAADEAATREAAGLEEASGAAPPPPPDPAARARAKQMLGAGGVLLVPDSTNRRVMAFDPTTGDLIDADFIPSDVTNLSTPIQAILSPGGDSILVSDQIRDVVQEYDLDGNYIGIFAPAGGVNTAILDNIRGIALRPNGNLLVTVGGGANTNSVAEFDTTGVYLGNFVTAGSGGLASPFDVYEVALTAGVLTAGEFLVAGIDSDQIHRYTAAGAPLANFAPINTFPEQIFQISSGANTGNVLVANFSPTAQEGVLEFTAAGVFVNRYDPAGLTGYRGVIELGNGNILTTTGTGVHEIDRLGNLVQSKITGISGRFIELVSGGAPTVTVDPVALSSYQPAGEIVVALLTIGNTGDGQLDWTITEAPESCAAPGDVAWLSVDPTAGSTAPGEFSFIGVTFDSTGLAAGVYTAVLCLASNDTENPLVTIPVQLIVASSLLDVPALTPAGLVGLAILLALLSTWAIRRRQHPASH